MDGLMHTHRGTLCDLVAGRLHHDAHPLEPRDSVGGGRIKSGIHPHQREDIRRVYRAQFESNPDGPCRQTIGHSHVRRLDDHARRGILKAGLSQHNLHDWQRRINDLFWARFAIEAEDR